jgi:hypothetical protein
MQQFLKAPSGTAGAGVIAAQLLDQFLITVHDAVAALHVHLGRVALPSFTAPFKSLPGRGVAWRTSGGVAGCTPCWVKLHDSGGMNVGAISTSPNNGSQRTAGAHVRGKRTGRAPAAAEAWR